MSEHTEKIAALEQALAEVAHIPAAADALRQQIAALRGEDARAQFELHAEGAATIHHNRLVYNAPGAAYYEALPDPQAAHAEQALQAYLAALSGESRTLQLGAFDDKDTRHPQAMRLAQVYVGLRVERHIEVRQAPQPDNPHFRPSLCEPRPLTVIEALLGAPDRRLMLLGQPGSGKSTFVNHLLLCLAEAARCEREGQGDASAVWLARLPGWDAGALLPVRVILRDLAAFADASAEPSPLALLYSFLRAAAHPYEDAVEPLLAALAEGRAILLFDGLDEVVGGASLDRVAATIQRAADTYGRSPTLVTCRVRDFQENPGRQIGGFAVDTLAPFDDGQIDQFVAAWYAELSATGRQMLGLADELNSAIGSRPELRRISGTPLLLTMMAVVHAGLGKLPEACALLYAQCIDLLLLRWRKEPDKPDVLAQVGIPEFGQRELYQVMAELGFLAHESARRDDANLDDPADLSREQVLLTLERAFAPYTEGDGLRRDRLVRLVLREIAGRNGLLLKRSGECGESYAFPHRTFQEFLAGLHIAQQKAYLKLSLERAAQPHWHEALHLMVGYQVHAPGSIPERPLALVARLAERGPLEQVLAGELLATVGWDLSASYDEALVAESGLWEKIRRALRHLAFGGQAPDVPAALRVRAGLALGALCYGTVELLARPCARPPLPDLLLPFASLDPEQACSPAWRGAVRAYWRKVPGGSFWFGDDRVGDRRAAQIGYTFAIGRYPITNAEYARFIAVGGYDLAQPWWTEHGRLFLQREPRSEPYLWDDLRWNNPLQPVVGVSWYEAAAYCRWLTVQGYAQGWLDRSVEIRLPTALEWERAARGDDSRRFPWGDQPPTPEHASYAETKMVAPAPVGCFPLGRSPYGVEELAGNVMEWLATPSERDMQVEPLEDVAVDETVVLSYCDWRNSAEHLSCGARYGSHIFSSDGQGFRLALVRSHGG